MIKISAFCPRSQENTAAAETKGGPEGALPLRELGLPVAARLFVQMRLTAFAFCTVAMLYCGFSLADEPTAGMQYPLAVVGAADGTIYVADRVLPGIWKITDGKPSLYFQGSKKFRTPLNAVRCLALDSKGVLYAGDSSTREVYRFDEPSKPTPMTNGAIGIPMSMAFDKEGVLYVANLEMQTVVRVVPSEQKSSVWTKTPAPRGLAVDSDNNVLVLCNLKQPLIRLQGEKKDVLIEEAIFEFANQVAVDESGNAYVTDGYAKAVWKVPKSGKPEKLFSGEPLKNPVGLAIQKDRLLIADPHQRQIYALPLSGEAKLQAIVK